jgi:RNA polymerase sigma-70 factor (ECF subfamily)
MTLITQAQKGCTASFEQLIAPFDKKILSLATSLASSHHDAEDIYQESMLMAFKSIKSFQSKSQLSTWLYRIVLNTAFSIRRKLRSKINQLIYYSLEDKEDKEDKQDEQENQILYEIAQDSPSNEPDTIMNNFQLSQAIVKSIQLLSPKERIAFILCHQHEIKIIEAAAIMQCSDGTVKNYLFRARKKMQITLQEYL